MLVYTGDRGIRKLRADDGQRREEGDMLQLPWRKASKEKGTVLDVEAEAFIADVEYEGNLMSAAASWITLSYTSGTIGATTVMSIRLLGQSLVNDSLRAELARCKQEMVSLERNKVKHDLDQTIIQRNKRNAELEEENVLLNEDSLVHAEVSRTKMSTRLGIIKPINYAKLNALYSHFVPQKELSREHVYWLPAEELATQINQRTDPCRYPRGSGEFKPVKAMFTEQIIPFYENVKQLVQKLNENILTEVTEYMRIFDELDTEEHSKVVELEAEILKKRQMLNESEKRCAFIEKNHLKDQLQGKRLHIKNCNSSSNITRMLYVGFHVGENVNLKRRYEELLNSNTYSRSTFTAKINALTAENAKLKTELISKISSGPTASEKPKVIAPGMYSISPKIMETHCLMPLELTTGVSSSSKVTMILVTDAKLSCFWGYSVIERLVPRGISGILDYRNTHSVYVHGHLVERTSSIRESDTSVQYTYCMVIDSPCFQHKELTTPEQTATGKEISNPFLADSLLKTISDGGVAVQRRWGWSEVGNDRGVRAVVVVRGRDDDDIDKGGGGVVFASAAGGGGRKPAGVAPDFERRREVGGLVACNRRLIGLVDLVLTKPEGVLALWILLSVQPLKQVVEEEQTQPEYLQELLQSLLKDLQILNEIQPLKQETSNQIQKDQEEMNIVEQLAEEKLQKANQGLNERQYPREMRIQDLEIQKQQCLEEIKEWMNDLGIREIQKEEIDIDYRRKCKDKIYELKDKSNG
ncbi:hypothetical protein Tco_1329911, partial [Tanacetum coccineum]